MVNTGGGAPSVMAIIEHLNASECRMRSVHGFTIGAQLEFNVSVHGAGTIPLRGRVVACRQNGPRYAYVLGLENAADKSEAIAKANEAAQARASAHAADIASEEGLTRGAVRIPVNFELRYSRHGSDARSAHAINISTGGVHMNTDDEIPVGTAIELQLPLGAQRVDVRGRIVAHQAFSPNYNVAFYEISNEARENLARFIGKHAA